MKSLPKNNVPSLQLENNPELELAFELVRYTDKSLFLTGKAGSGKTTFLRQIRAEVTKRMAVVAPTGVAAINAGGMTIHSLFQIVPGLHLPDMHRSSQEQQRKFSANKIRLLRSIDLLVIDEISMVRADLLDAIDEVLRRYRRSMLPFAGVQLLMIGDLHQLPPVNKPDEWQILSKYYATPYFFSSRALQQTDYKSIELKRIYRQSDPDFVALLNKVRDNQLDSDSLRKLNTRFIPGFQPAVDETYITLTTTNGAAQEINSSKLRQLRVEPQIYTARIEGDFPASCYPTEVNLAFKPGAQVMFIRNDLSQDKLYFNGKVGHVLRLEPEAIYVTCPGESTEIAVTPTEWKNIKFSLNEETKQIDELVLGSFFQMPLKLAWAITIHKSQGLTFERAIIDAQASFASGQVYVALSRCKSFEGIVLRTPLNASSVLTDHAVRQFTEQAVRNSPDKAFLLAARREFECHLLRELFSFSAVRTDLDRLLTLYRNNAQSLSDEVVVQLQSIVDRATQELFSVAQKFSPQLDGYLALETMPSENVELQGRIVKAAQYFIDKLTLLNTVLQGLPAQTDNQATNGNITSICRAVQLDLHTKSMCFQACRQSFSSDEYQKAKVNAELELTQLPRRSNDTSGFTIPPGVSHTELYRQLLELRKRLAKEANVGPQAIFPNATLRSLVDSRPSNLTQLRLVPGIGKKRIKAFGPVLCEVIAKYCHQHTVTCDQNSPAVAKKNSVDNSYQVTPIRQQSFEKFLAGKSIDEIAAERGVTKSTIEGHLVPFIATGQIEVFALMNKESVEEIAAQIQAQPNQSLAELKMHFGDKYGYGEIKMTMGYLQSSRAKRGS